MCARCALHIYFTEIIAPVMRCKTTDLPHAKASGGQQHVGKVRIRQRLLSSGLASQAIYGKACGLNPGLWLSALPDIPVSMGISNIRGIGYKQAH